MAHFAAPVLFALAVISAGIWHGQKTHRWGEAPSYDVYTAKLRMIPEKFGDWESDVSNNDDIRNTGLTVAELPNGKKEYRFTDDLKHHGIHDYIFRVYRNTRGIDSFQVLVVCGDAGHIAAHSPDVCYRGEGFTTVGDPKKMDFATKQDGPNRGRTFPLLTLKLNPPKSRVTSYELEIRWAWIPPDTGAITVSDSPRMKFSSQPALYKVYVIQKKAAVSGGQMPTNAPVIGASPTVTKVSEFDLFLESFLPRLEAALKNPETTP
jgi:hypothetical protein